MQTFEPREFYTVSEVAIILRMDPDSFRKCVMRRGRIAYHQDRPGAMIRIRHDDLEAYIASTRVEIRPEKGGKIG